MSDIFTKEKRSQIMSSIRSKNTGIEKTLKAAMKSAGMQGFAYQKKMLGNPDFASEKQKIAIFCDGDFWHGYNFKEWGHKLNDIWFNKITSNMRRDRAISRKLKAQGWTVIRFWGHQIEKHTKTCINRIMLKMKERQTIKS